MLTKCSLVLSLRMPLGFPGGSVIKTLLADARDMGLIPDPTGGRAAKPVRHNYQACALDPRP